ncbi:MAG: protein kinase domain-containing protein [Thermoanaerobaculia bacterium]
MPQLNGQTIRRSLPQPIAAAWHRVAFAQSDADSITRVVACYEIILRTITALLLPDYLRGPESPEVEAALRKLERPSLGMWFGLVRALVKYLGKRQDPPPFIPETRDWFFTGDKLTPAARTLERIVRTRNEVIHDQSGIVTPAIVTKSKEELLSGVRSILTGLDWLPGYRIFRILTSEPTKQSTFNGKIQFFTGIDDNTPEPGRWDVFLVPQSVYLSNPAGTELLEVSPFLEMRPDETGVERLYLIKQIPGFRQIMRTNDVTTVPVTSPVSNMDETIMFDEWLQKRPLDLHHSLKTTNGVFRSSVYAGLARGETDLGPAFDVVGELGRGGMAVVYEAREKKSKKSFALKVLNRELAEESNYRQRFHREALNMRKVQNQAAASSCIVPMLDVGELPSGQPYLKMPVMPKGSLNEQIRQPGGCPEAHVRGWAETALEALSHVHAAGMVHRDIKPSNFLLDDKGRALLTDFGIALGPEDERLTRTLEQMGTVAYMAPEQRTLRTVTEKADIYGLAVVLHELLRGELPEGDPGEGVESALGELIRSMGARTPATRPSAVDALSTLRAVSYPAMAESTAVVKSKRGTTGKRRATTGSRKRLRAIADQEEARKAAEEGEAKEAEAAALAAKQQQEVREQRHHIVLALAMLAALFVLNVVETGAESWLRRQGVGIEAEQHFAEAAQWLEGNLDFGGHDTTWIPAVYVFSFFYFFVFPVAAILAIAVFLWKRDTKTLLLFSTAAAIDYAIALPFYVLFPLPERWAYAGSKAVLLSDLLDSRLIDYFRPFSGLNNCFPSFHVSGTVIIVLCLFHAKAPFRNALAFSGAAIILTTFILGIHWLPDIIAGIAAGIISVRLGERFVPRLLQLYSAGTGGAIAAGTVPPVRTV